MAQRRGSGVHDLEVAVEHLTVGDGVEALGVRVRLGVRVVDAVDVGGLHQDLSANLARPERRGGVGGEVRVASSGSVDSDASLLEVADGAATDVGLGDLAHLDGAHDTAVHPVALEAVLERERVNDCGEHAHVVALRTVHAGSRTLKAAEDVPATYDDGDLDAGLADRGDLLGEPLRNGGIDAVGLVAHQRLPRELEKNALVPYISQADLTFIERERTVCLVT